MEKVDAKKEIDTLLQHCGDVEHFIGFTLVQDNQGRAVRFAFVRLIFKEDQPLRDWPKKLVYRRAVELGTGVELFSIYEPPNFLTPMVTTEWDDSYQAFIDAAEHLKMFTIEIVTPTRKMTALIVNDGVKETAEEAITAEDYEFLNNHAFSDPSEAPGAEPKQEPS